MCPSKSFGIDEEDDKIDERDALVGRLAEIDKIKKEDLIAKLESNLDTSLVYAHIKFLQDNEDKYDKTGETIRNWTIGLWTGTLVAGLLNEKAIPERIWILILISVVIPIVMGIYDEIFKSFRKKYKEEKDILIKKFQQDSWHVSWKEIPGKENGRLIEFLAQVFDIDWVRTANIIANDDGTIKISTEKHYLSMKLNDENTEVLLEIDNVKTSRFTVKKINDELNIINSSKKSDIKLPNQLKDWELIETAVKAFLSPRYPHVNFIYWLLIFASLIIAYLELKTNAEMAVAWGNLTSLT